MQTRWVGAPLIALLGINAAYAGVVLAKSWMIVEERWPELKENCRYPYSAIGSKAYGPKTRAIVSLCLHTNLIGSCVVVLLLCAQIIHDLTAHHFNICFCYWILIIAAIICPFLFFETPKEFWPAAALALGTTSIAVCVILWEMYKDHISGDFSHVRYPQPSLKTFFLTFGTIMFAYGATASFPTFQNDMRKRHKFPTAVIIAFIVLLALYIPIASVGYYVYGDLVEENVILTLEDGLNKTVIEILMASHLFFAFLLLANAPIQEIESWLKIPNGFNVKRLATRILVLLFIVFLGETIPSFGKILNLIGGSAIALLSFVFPPMFYMKLCSMNDPQWPKRNISAWEKLWLLQVIIIGIIGGSAGTLSALYEILSPKAFIAPCYINLNCK
ncbi:amino acid transporter ANT1-like protein [Dinothrombium tinctorium]|uniref:Amino acid transporter ANT1-like protein n=1 Tax=Dinothrombium tinctorium TaxID=1965070 RepID=A0A3S3S9L9_9ACAR|nr:amino acid transporter ANT1-like protein [Dinothrombium tinctorium]RWS11122.1 amino acid transporter ANT1-like protein [Dinothrombium tinctorium]